MNQVLSKTDNVRFLCLSDFRLKVQPPAFSLPLIHGWPGWWSKIEAFTIPGPAIYLDLDTTVLDDLTPLFCCMGPDQFYVLRDFNYPARIVQSSVMGWGRNCKEPYRLYEIFMRQPKAEMDRNKTHRFWGDQGFIERHVQKPSFWQECHQGAFRSYKLDVARNGVDERTLAVVHHGRPRPWELPKQEA